VFVPFDVLLRVGLDVVVLEAAAERVKEGDAEAVRVEPIVLVPDDVEDVVFDLAGVDEEVLLEVVVLDDDVDAERVFVVIVLRVLREEEVDVLLTSAESVPFCVDTIVLVGKELLLIRFDARGDRVNVVVFVDVLDCVEVDVATTPLFNKYLESIFDSIYGGGLPTPNESKSSKKR
jgi:hypothetical protein